MWWGAAQGLHLVLFSSLGVFICRGKEDALVTKNLVPGESVYGEKRVSIAVRAEPLLTGWPAVYSPCPHHGDHLNPEVRSLLLWVLGPQCGPEDPAHSSSPCLPSDHMDLLSPPSAWSMALPAVCVWPFSQGHLTPPDLSEAVVTAHPPPCYLMSFS